MTQKEAFLFHLQRMDIEMLDATLSDKITYFGVTKTVFLQKLSYLFNHYKLAGETGFLNLKQEDKTSNIYYLCSKTLLFEPEFIIEEKDGTILNISNSVVVNTKKEFYWLHHLELFFGDDEKANFEPSNEYTRRLQKCTTAFEKFVNNETQTLTSDVIFKWLKKYKSLYNQIKHEYLMFKYNDFRELYCFLNKKKNCLKCYLYVEIALRLFDDSDPVKIQKWIGDFDELYFRKLKNFRFGLNSVDEIAKTIRVNNYPNILLKGEDFISIIKFNELHLDHCKSNPEMDDFQMGYSYFSTISED